MKAPVNKIIPFSSVDGPGNRTAVFLQGCNFNCKYCHNPETIKTCISCGECVKNCPVNALKMVEGKVVYEENLCANCDTCIKVCRHGSSPKINFLTPEETFQKIERQKAFIRGVTVSGGECTRHLEFLKEFLEICKKNNLHTLLDSNGSFDFETDQDLLAVLDGVMLDIKAFEKAEHLDITGKENEVVLKNAVFLAEVGKLLEVRTVIVPELFDTKHTVTEVANLLKPFVKEGKKIRYKLIKYRSMGVREQYANYEEPSEEWMEELKLLLESYDVFEVIIL